MAVSNGHQSISPDYDVIVIGAGVLGAALGTTLGRMGRHTLVLERDLREPDRIVGELLQPGGYRALQALGLQECTEGIDAIPCNGYHIQSPTRQSIAIQYPLIDPNSTAEKESDARYHGRSFHHGRFVNKLRQVCGLTPGVSLVEATVSDLLRCPVTQRVIGVKCYSKLTTTTITACDDQSNNTQTTNTDRQYYQYYAPLVIVADGCFSKFRKECGAQLPHTVSHFCGFILRDCKLPSPRHGHVILTPNAPILIYQVNSIIGADETRILVDIPGKLPSIGNGDMKKYLVEQIAPHLPSSVMTSFHSALESERFRVMPTSRLTSTINQEDGVIVLGDALNMRHPLTGAGMTVALNDVLLLPMQQCKLTLHTERKSYACVLNVLAHGIYTIFAADPNDPQMKVMQKACFNYFRLGGQCVDGPVGLLGGIYQSQWLLISHFYSVAMYGLWLILSGQMAPNGDTLSVAMCLLNLPANLVRCVITLWAASWLLLPAMLAEFMA
ncbi:squalene epoxidase-domain-containing protein [Syncephalis fuscata]|nr:squalene epoxidase-domain-containing protein [Syncephalis fuscata]